MYAQFMEQLGNAKDRDFNIDLIPKFIMAHGNLVKILLHTKVMTPPLFNDKPVPRYNRTLFALERGKG